MEQKRGSKKLLKAHIHDQFESLGFVGKYDQSSIKLVNS
jgi:hypothetical protein